jgi:uncharacterized protein (TIGR00725 family)
MKRQTPVVTIFGSSRPKVGEPVYNTAYEVGKLVAQSGFTICNGGYGGIMEASARGAKDAGGKTIGVVTQFFGGQTNKFIDKKIITKSLVERLIKLIELGDAYVVLKGSTGTLVELAMVWEYMNKKVICEKPIVVIGRHWSSVIKALKKELVFEGSGKATKFVSMVPTPRDGIHILRHKLGNISKCQDW